MHGVPPVLMAPASTAFCPVAIRFTDCSYGARPGSVLMIPSLRHVAVTFLAFVAVLAAGLGGGTGFGLGLLLAAVAAFLTARIS